MALLYHTWRYLALFSVRYCLKILKPKKDAAKGSSSLDDLDFDEDDEETEVVETEQTEQEDDNL